MRFSGLIPFGVPSIQSGGFAVVSERELNGPTTSRRRSADRERFPSGA